ncbi:MAG: hypothetical protein ABIY55_26375 [Kofleriaceae bacterium]
MTLPAPRWLKAVVLLTVGAFLAQAIVVFGVRFTAWLESDATVPALLAARTLHNGVPIATDWYYANGDVWVIAPQLFAILPVALLGIGQLSLWLSIVVGFALELVVLVRAYAGLAGSRWLGGLAAVVTLAAWSPLHIRFVYIQLAYGFGAVLYLVVFAVFATCAVAPATAWRRLLGVALLVLAIAVQNPTRGLVFVLAPLVIGCAWPWRELAARRRLVLAAAAVLGWLAAAAFYHLALRRAVSFAYPAGHIDFVVVQHGSDVTRNLGRLWDGAQMLCGARTWMTPAVVPGGLVLIGALALVGREVVRARQLTALRVVCVVVVVQLGVVAVPLVIGNLMIAPTSVRYLMPSLMLILGLAAVLAVRAVAEPARGWRALATSWLVLVPLALVLAIGKTRPPVPKPYVWADPRELPALGAELARRGLTHGFSSLINENLIALGARGDVRVCPVYFARVMIPQRWLADTACYTASALPARFFVVTDHVPGDAAALRQTLPPPEQRFPFGARFDVAVYRTAAVPLAWLAMPIHDGDELALPLRLTASHPAVQHGAGVVEGDRVVATGAPGSILWGPSLRLPRGGYRVTWRGHAIISPGQVTFRVVADDEVLARTTLDPALAGLGAPIRVELRFAIDQPRDRVEVVVESGGGARITLDDVTIERP